MISEDATVAPEPAPTPIAVVVALVAVIDLEEHDSPLVVVPRCCGGWCQLERK